MNNDNYLNNKINEVGCLYEHDLLKDFLQDEYREDDFLYNFYSSCVEEIESINLANCIYESLWEWRKENQDKISDVMNSFNIYMNKAVHSMIGKDDLMNKAFEKFKSITGNKKQKASKQLVLYFIRNHDIKEKIKEELNDMIQLSKWTNTIGNLILLPQTKRGRYGENVYKNAVANDRVDIYLDNLKRELKDEEFREYINQNYLWDYVNEKYEVIQLFLKAENKNLDKILPNDHESYRDLAKNIIKNIKRRGMFMEIMIRLSIELPEYFCEVKDTKNEDAYSKVIEKIENDKTINLSENLECFINKFQEQNNLIPNLINNI